MSDDLVIRPIGQVQSVLTNWADAPRQGDEGAPDAWLVFDASVRDGLRDLDVGSEVLLRPPPEDGTADNKAGPWTRNTVSEVPTYCSRSPIDDC
jgi:tRNA (Thr-GGU) A37 N-methylase